MAIFTINVTQQSTFAASPAERTRALKSAFEAIGRTWHHRYKLKKFRSEARQEYGLKPRLGDHGSGVPFKGSYVEAKVRKRANGQNVRALGENKPFVWSGKSRSDAVASNRVRVTKARSTGFVSADCIINAPTLNFRPKNGRINLREEFERVTEGEVRELEKHGIAIYQLNLGRIKYKRSTTFRA